MTEKIGNFLKMFYNQFMCFSVPYKIVNRTDTSVELENGETIPLDGEFNPVVGEYLQMSGTIIVSVLSATEGKKIQTLLAKLNSGDTMEGTL